MTDMYQRHVIQKTFGKLQFELGNFNSRLVNQEWTEIDYASLIREHYYGIDVYDCDIDEVKDSALRRA
jgi:hypothetical protein